MPDTWDYETNRPPAVERAPGHPILTRAVVILCIAITLANQTQEMGKGTWWEAVGRFGYSDAPEIWGGHYWSMFTSVFVHGAPGNPIGTILHIGFNMMWLMTLGTVLELTLNPLIWAVFFITSAVVGSGAELAADGQTGVGASGVVYAMFGLLWAGRSKFDQWRSVATPHNFNLFVIWGIFCLIATWSGEMHIANAAHGGGFLFGLATGWLFIDMRPRMKVIGGFCIAGLIALTVLSVTWMPWSPYWIYWKEHRSEFPTARRATILPVTAIGPIQYPCFEAAADLSIVNRNAPESRRKGKCV